MKKILIPVFIIGLSLSNFSFAQNIKKTNKNENCSFSINYKKLPVRFVFYSEKNKKYIFGYMNDNKKNKFVVTSDHNKINHNNNIYTTGKKMFSKNGVTYYQICKD